MADIFAWWSQDLVILPNGDLLVATGTVEGEQRVLRRLLTNPGAYIWHPEYGAGLPRYVGATFQHLALNPGESPNPTVNEVAALIMAQMLIEDAVSQNPLPVVSVSPITNGLNANIKYVDATTGTTVSTGFDVNS